MDAPKLLPGLLTVFVLATAGCRGTPPPQPVTKAEPPQPTTQEAAAPAAPTPTPASPAAPQPKAANPARDGDPVVVDPGVDDGVPKTLVEAARAEKQRRANAGDSTIVINDKTLPKYAAKGQITVMDVRKNKKPGEKAPAAAGAPAETRGEMYWRSRGLEIRERWRQAAEDVKTLEQKTTELRQKFYLENDIYVRDNQVRPEWDRALDRLRQAKQDVETAKTELTAFLEEGREQGALPGWLREGEDKEPFEENARKPEPSEKDPLPEHQSIEPPIFNPGDIPPPGASR
jgi:hypothetical protein